MSRKLGVFRRGGEEFLISSETELKRNFLIASKSFSYLCTVNSKFGKLI